MDELFIYDRDKGLFKEILKQSFVMEGRYHVSPDSGQDLNSNNLGTLVAAIPEKKYPLCVCVTPRSAIGTQSEEFYFTLLFVCQTYNDMNNPKTKQSTHEVWYDWKDMKQAAKDFLLKLDEVTRKNIAHKFNVDTSNVVVRRLSRFGEDRLSGVMITFTGLLMDAGCEVTDYPPDFLANFVMPDFNVHAQHKH
jgi:hypothetical protein